MLQRYRIGDSIEYISVEYAKSGRSKCKACKAIIDKDQLRIGILADSDHYENFQGTQWFHKSCFSFKPRHKVLEIDELEKKVHNLSELKKKDASDVIKYLKENLAEKKSGTKSKKQGISKQETKPKSKKNEEKDQSIDAKKGRTVSKSKVSKAEEKSKSKAQKVQKASKSKPKPEQKSETVKPGKGRGVSKQKQEQKREVRSTRSTALANKGVSKPKQSQPTVQPKKIKVPKIKVAKQSFLSETQKATYKQYLKDFSEMSVKELQQILQKNSQTKTGTKGDLAAKCADGKQFGRTPQCLKCGGGRLRFNREKGVYTCPGYMQDTDFKNCGTTFKFEEVKRDDWID